MGRYLRGRLVTAIPVFFGITLIVFLLLHLAPGSIVDLAGEGSARAAGQAAGVEAYLGLDRSLPAQFRQGQKAFLQPQSAGQRRRQLALGGESRSAQHRYRRKRQRCEHFHGLIVRKRDA